MNTDKLIEAKIKDFREGWADDEEMEQFLATALNEVVEKAREEGRQSVLDEWKEEQEKLLKGLSYRPKKKD